MNAAKQACRPKHQVLVLKCYPKFQKNNVDVKANSSELAYLLYYANTKRSKLQKVGEFLDKRTTADVWKGRLGNVRVTVEILKALIAKCPRDLPLFAGAVLRMLRTILKSNEVAMVEESVPTFEALCAHQDPANLAANQDYIQQYEEVVRLYAQFASKERAKDVKNAASWPVTIRFRQAGLRALKAVASSESLGSETGRQLDVTLPAILLNIHSDSGAYLRQLERLDLHKGDQEKEQARRRQSVSTVHTNEEDKGDAVAAAGTTEDADKRAEEEAGVLALQALRSIFNGVNRGQLRLATNAVLNFVVNHTNARELFDGLSSVDKNWSTTLMAMVCAWAPVQDRYAILVSAMETLIRSPIIEDDLERQLVLAIIIEYLLRSDINFIGLSVMDVLVGLISHILLLLQLGGSGSSVVPHHQQDIVGMEKEPAGTNMSGDGGLVMEVVKKPSLPRMQLLEVLQRCMASLATHVYYTDQISDMAGALLNRLKPSPMSGVSNAAEAIEDPASAITAVASSASLYEKSPHIDRFFSFETARLLALQSVKDIVITANARRATSSSGSSAPVSRARIGVSVWEGTQWLLRDPSGKVRKAYVDALVTWLKLEKNKDDLKIVEDYRKKEKENEKGAVARRAVSNASYREKSPKRGRNTFLSLLHLAVYENALQYTDSEPDLLLLHLLLTTLIQKIGINAVRSGLPMMWRLQEDIHIIENPGSKVRIGSLVHGYFWALSMALGFEASSVGRALHAEISRRNSKGLWVTKIRVPPVPLEQIDTPHPDPVRLPTDVVQNEALKPFDNRQALVDKIAEGYSTTLVTPPSSPPASPSHGRSASITKMGPPTLKTPPRLPSKVKEELLSDWTRDVCIAANTKDSSSASMTGSRTVASTQQKNNYLGVNIPTGNFESPHNSPLPSPHRARSRPPSTAYGLVGRTSSPHRHRSRSQTPGSSSSVHSAVRVDDLKRVLSGAAPRTSYSIRAASHRHEDSSHESSASESLVSVHSLSDASFMTNDHASPQLGQGEFSAKAKTNTASSPTTTTTSNAVRGPSAATNATRERDVAFAGDVPPVPPIPVSLRDSSISPSRPRTAPSNRNANGSANGTLDVQKSRSVKRSSGRSSSRGRTSGNAIGEVVSGGIVSGVGSKKAKKPDFSGFLDSIDVGGGEEEEGDGGVGGAPY